MNNIIENIVLAGGGFYGYAQAAALNALFDSNITIHLKNICGVSAGSMIAALIAVGYAPSEVLEILENIDFNSLIKDNQLPYINLVKKFGMYDAILLHKYIEKLIYRKTGIRKCTFSQLEINLTIVATDLNYQCPCYFNKNTDPDMPISKAVRMSISYPIIISPMVHNGTLYGDGGNTVNFPFSIYDDAEKTIGITFSTIDENADGSLKRPHNISNLVDYVRSIGQTLSRTAYIAQASSNISRYIVIDIDVEIDSMQFNLNENQINSLYNCGVNAVDNFLKMQFNHQIMSRL